MPGGFGSGPFGQGPFGSWSWGKHILYELAPDIYRSQDPDGLFQAYADGVAPVLDRNRALIQKFADLKDPLRVRTDYSSVQRLRLGRVVQQPGRVEQRGGRGFVDALSQFVSPSGRFRSGDAGKELVVRGSVLAGNNGRVRVVQVVSLTTVFTDPPLRTDAGPLEWELRPYVADNDFVTVEVRGGDALPVGPGWRLSDGAGDFEVIARRVFPTSGVSAWRSEREGADGALDGSGVFTAASGAFTAADVGKVLTLISEDVPADNGRFEILSVDTSVDPPQVVLDGLLSEADGLWWGLAPWAELDIAGSTVPAGVVEQDGVDLEVVGGGSTHVISTGALFSATDVGKYLRVVGSEQDQDGQYVVVALVSANEVEVDQPLVTAETGLRWELRSGTSAGDVEACGFDAEVIEVDAPAVGQCRVQVSRPSFSRLHVGMTLELSGSLISGNDGSYEVLDIEDAETLVVSSATLGLDLGPLTWRVLSADYAKAEARAESMIQYLAQDYGVEIDRQESDARQRSWVQHVNVWLDRKGHEEAYKLLGEISGFVVSVFHLWRVDARLVATLPSSVIYEVGEAETGRAGSDGFLSEGVYLTAASAAFVGTDLGRSIRVGNSATSTSNKLYTIAEVVSATQVRFRMGDEAEDLPDYGDGGVYDAPTLTWSVTRVYCSEPPKLPRMDDFNSDLMTAYIAAQAPPTDVFGIDRYCWESDFDAFVGATINSVTLIEGNRYEVAVTPDEPDMILSPGGPKYPFDLPVWKIRDVDGVVFVLETWPDLAGGDWTFDVYASPTQLPALGAGRLEYQCPTQASCAYCGSNKLAVVIETGAVAAESGPAVNRVLERVLQRLRDHPRPTHVELVPIFKSVLEVSWTMDVEITAGTEIYPTMAAYWGPLFDDIPADEVELDEGPYVEIESS